MCFTSSLAQANGLEEDSMELISRVRTVSFWFVALGALVVAGCGGAGAKGPDAARPATSAADSSADDACAVAGWCTEHGVPEDLCAQCNAKVAAEYQKKGDWCKEHDRPESQCFLCDPKRAEQFAAEYEAQYGKKPPKAEVK